MPLLKNVLFCFFCLWTRLFVQRAEALMLSNEVQEGLLTELGQNKIEDVKSYELDHIFPPSTTQDQVQFSSDIHSQCRTRTNKLPFLYSQ